MKIVCLFAPCFLAVLPFMLASCMSSIHLGELIAGASDSDRKLRPETEWNILGIWQRISEQPATYIPQGLEVSAPRGENDGRWFVDKRDGKRLFVPNGEVGEFSNGVLVGEAMKIVGQGARQNLFNRRGIRTRPGIMMQWSAWLFARDGCRILAIEGMEDPSGALQAPLAWAHPDVTKVVARLPVDRRHPSKIDYEALQASISWSFRPTAGGILVAEVSVIVPGLPCALSAHPWPGADAERVTIDNLASKVQEIDPWSF